MGNKHKNKGRKRARHVIRDLDDIPAAAQRLVKLAGELGLEVEVRSPRKHPNYVAVGGWDHERGIGFTAAWLDGKTAGAFRYHRQHDWHTEPETRPAVAYSKAKRAKVRTGYDGPDRLVYDGGPGFPTPLGVSALVAWLKGLQ